MHIPNEEVIPVLHADHISICKIPSGDCIEFVTVAQKIIDVVRKLDTGLAKAPLDSPCKLRIAKSFTPQLKSSSGRCFAGESAPMPL